MADTMDLVPNPILRTIAKRIRDNLQPKPSVMEGYDPNAEAAIPIEPGLEAPMFSPDDLIGSGVLKAGAATAAGLGGILGKMFLGRGGKDVPSKLRQSGALIANHPSPYNADLIPIHKTTEGGLSDAMDAGGLFSPSYAITKNDTLGDKFGKVTLLLRGNKIDPELQPGTLFNRDAYTRRIPRILHDDRATPEQIKEALDLELQKLRELAGVMRGSAGRLKMTEGAHPSGGFMHRLAIEQSPSFRSFDEFLRNPQGAALVGDREMADIMRRRDSRAFEQWIQKYNQLIALGKDPMAADEGARKIKMLKAAAGKQWDEGFNFTPEYLEQLKRTPAFGKFSEDAQDILRRARVSPSTYAEGKVIGNMPIDPRYVQAVIPPPEAVWNKRFAYLKDALRERNIPVVSHDVMQQDIKERFGSPAYMSEVLRRVSQGEQ